ncbi:MULTISPECIES: TRAP transporter small permease [Paracoccaceae]|uniref:TRAP transporter small permease protein n=2 Tax=Paracoccaceae TaxID=31989 RepID=A0ABW2UPR2_9RHOB
MPALTLLRLCERSILVVIFLTMVALYFVSVLARELGGQVASSFAWIEEAVRMLNLFLVFLGLGLALERGRHVGIRNLRDRLPETLRRGLLKVTDVVGLGFALYIAWLGWGLASFVLGTGQRSPTLGIAMGYVYLAPVAGFLLLALRYGLSLFGVIDRFSDAEGAE